MITTYFGEFVDSDTKHSQPLEELTGTVKVHSLNGVEAAFLYSPDDSKKGYTRYDIPSFGKKLQRCYCSSFRKENNKRSKWKNIQ